MNPESWQRLQSAFDEAIALDPEARAAHLARLARGDATLHAQLEPLLRAHASAEALLDRPALDHLATESDEEPAARWTGRRIGPYELLELIGRGGMGEVYRARRADAQYEQLVAVKLVRTGFDIDFVLQRLRTERQILAHLEHPGIARLLDGGATEEGLPYLVMELVEGEPIDAYCASHASSVEHHLALFREVCAAVAYAHQRLVVHRDLKPGNILVKADGTVKLLDFGIAKLLQEGAVAAGAEPTQTLMTAMTPAFSSPEQILGRPITTASDVYSLGVVLYTLVTGSSPYRSAISSAGDAIREVCETEPRRPSLIDRDLEDILLKALRKEPGERYATVEQFSEDLQRYLTGQPVRAHGGHFGYRARKFLRRNRWQAAAALLVVLSMIAGTAVSIREARIAQAERERAQRHFESVRRLADTFMFQFHDAIRDLPGATQARQLVVKTSLDYLNALAAEPGADAGLRRDLAAAYKKVGDIQGQPYNRNLGDPAGARRSYLSATALLEPVVRTGPHDLEARWILADAYRDLGMLVALMGDPGRGIDTVRQAAQVLEAATPAERGTPRVRLQMARVYRALSVDQMYAGRNGESRAALAKSIELLESLRKSSPRDPELGVELAKSHSNLGVLLQSMPDAATPAAIAAIESEYARSADLLAQVIASDAVRNTAHVRNLAAAQLNLGLILYQQGDAPRAEPVLQQSLRNIGEVATDLRDLDAQLLKAQAAARLGRCLIDLHRYGEARQGLEDAARSLSGMLAHNDTLAVEFMLGIAREALGEWHWHAAQSAAGAERVRELRAAGDDFQDAITRMRAVGTHVTLDIYEKASLNDAVTGLAKVQARLQRTAPAAARPVRMSSRAWPSRETRR